MRRGKGVSPGQPVEKVPIWTICHAEFISASRKINEL